MAKDRVIVFVKAPRPGAVKTRLARNIGAERACDVYRSLVRAVLGNIRSCRDVELRFAPDDAVSEISAWLQPGWVATPQGDGNLGDRLSRAFDAAFESGADRVLIIGSDCPHVNLNDLAAGFAGLDGAEIVLGPAADGGYWLIGLRKSAPTIFHEIAWSTERVLDQTVERAQASGLRVHMLRMLDDVDTEMDWNRWKNRGFAQGEPPISR